MTKKSPAKYLASNQSVVKATGKTWPQWFKILDKFPKGKTHTERAQWLYDNHLKKGWWCQMVTVTYEQARGLRKKHETATGFQIGASKTLPLSLKAAYQWFASPAKLKLWLDAKDFEITSATPGKYAHIRWHDGSRVDIGFYTTGPKKTSVQLQHSKLKNAAAAKKQQAWWRERLEVLDSLAS